ncbi:MAG: DNA mismatch repair protein MutS [Chloroflexi bacterium]|nr:DNA mismatch repair protein MutS [Chloroflexota bacterium]
MTTSDTQTTSNSARPKSRRGTGRRLSPGRRQYLQFKAKYADSLLLFRMGDFYECFDEDARTLSKLLDVALTSRDVGGGQKSALAGIPYHSLDTHIGRLVASGLKIAIAEQTTSEPNSEGIVDRAVVRVVTPGTVLDQSLLEQSKHNYLAACVIEASNAGLAWLEASTGEFAAMELPAANIIDYIERLEPAEILVDTDTRILLEDITKNDTSRKSALSKTVIRSLDESTLDPELAADSLKSHFNTDTLEAFELENQHLATIADASAKDILAQTQIGRLPFITTLRRHRPDRYMYIPAAALRDLEVLTPTVEGGPTLLNTLDTTRTPMGARLLRDWLSAPLTDLNELNTRQLAVNTLYNDSTLRSSLDQHLTGIPDLARLVNRLTLGQSEPRELRQLFRGLDKAPELRQLTTNRDTGASISRLFDGVSSHDEVRDLIDRAIVEDPPFRISDGGMIKADFDHDLDVLRSTASRARSAIASIEAKARQDYDIPNLRVSHNRVFGYYIEVSRSHLSKVPPEFERKQTLVNAERFITPELKDLENQVLRAVDQISELEQSIYRRVCQQVAEHAAAIMRTASAIANIDVCLALARIAAENDWTLPFLDNGDLLKIEDGRHPVVENVLGYGRFVPNDLNASNSENQLLIITGPNMSGKSTYIRQAAILTILAQIGSFVPAKFARVGIVDRIFTRIGISDDIAGGRSTFMVEMVETASILNQATPRSLAILDEIGRGTSTYDGLAIARSVAEFIHNSPALGCKTLFATHYHEMTELGETLPRANNLRVAVAEEGESIQFLYRIVQGGADRSYGIHVAQLAGMPAPVVERARELLTELENHTNSTLTPAPASDHLQLDLFNTPSNTDFLRSISEIDTDNLTPIEALNRLYELKQAAQKEL